MLKQIIATALFICSTSSFASSVLTQLPFDIKIGQTTNNEIQKRGFCEKKIKVTDSYFRCERFSMANGKFTVFSSENEIVSAIEFKVGNTLPTSWVQQGIRLSNKSAIDIAALDPFSDGLRERLAAVPGNRIAYFKEIISNEGAQNIVEETVYRNDSIICRKVTFFIDDYYFVATFFTLPAIENYPIQEKDLGLYGIEITENY